MKAILLPANFTFGWVDYNYARQLFNHSGVDLETDEGQCERTYQDNSILIA